MKWFIIVFKSGYGRKEKGGLIVFLGKNKGGDDFFFQKRERGQRLFSEG